MNSNLNLPEFSAIFRLLDPSKPELRTNQNLNAKLNVIIIKILKLNCNGSKWRPPLASQQLFRGTTSCCISYALRDLFNTRQIVKLTPELNFSFDRQIMS